MPNIAPSGTDTTVTIPQNYALRKSNFGFTDTDSNGFLAVKITTLASTGTLYYDSNGALGGGRTAVTAGQTISAADIAAGKLTFVASGSSSANFTFQVQDNGGTASGGIDLDPSANTLTFNVSASAATNTLFGTLIDLTGLTTGNGFKLNGENIYWGSAGASVSSAGDVNGDGFADIIVGAPALNEEGNKGTAYVVFGKAAGFGTVELSSLDGTAGFKILGQQANDEFGRSVASAGDINGDGYADIIVGASKNANVNGVQAGAAYVIYGKASGFATIDTATMAPSSGFKLIGPGPGPLAFAGYSVASAGDINGDGFADMIIGANRTGNGVGTAYIIFGKSVPFAGTIDLGTLAAADGFKVQGEADANYLGKSVSSAGDVNGDGFADLLIGGYQNSNNSLLYNGAAYVIFGKSTSFGTSVSLSGLTSTTGFKIQGEASGDYAGWSVSSAGDINGDGYADILVGAFRNDGGGANAGAVYVVFGKNTGIGTVNLGASMGSAGFKITGEAASDSAGIKVSSAGDVNGDGFLDILIGAPGNDSGGSDAGAAYVIFGRSTGLGNINLGSLAAADGFKIQGDVANDSAGVSVKAAGDINGDGYADLIVGASGIDGAQINTGAAYVIFGRSNSNLPTVSINNVTAPESTSPFAFTVSLSAASASTVTVNYATANGTASSTGDYSATSGTVTFAPGDTSKTVNVTVANDTIYESNETFTVTLSAPTNATIATGTGTGTIVDNDAAPVFNFSSATYSIAEGNAGTTLATFTVTKTGATELASSVNFATSNGTATTAGGDYVANSGTLNFAAGDTSKTFTVTINGDTTTEPNETFNVTLSSPSGGTLGAQSTAVATITNDDNAPPTATNLSAAESYTEDTPLNLTDIVVTDTDSANVTATLTLSNTAAGTLSTATSNAVISTFSSGVWTASGAIADVNALLAGVTFNPAANFNSGFSITTSVSDGVSTAVTGSKAFTGTSVNDAPSGANATLTILEDGVSTLTAADFGFTDPNDSPANALLAVRITTLPGAGSLTLNNVAVSQNAFIAVADINAGLLQYRPAANGNGTGYATIGFAVQDNGGTTNSGVDLDASPNTLTYNVTSVNDAPVGTAVTKTFSEDTRYTFALADFGFTDPNDTPANALTFVRIASFATTGIVYLDSDGSGPNAPVNQNALGAGMYISAADITAGHLYYTPVANAVGSSAFTFQVTDDGGTTNSGANIDPTARTFTLTTTSVNDAPAGTDAVLTINEDTPRSFTAADFGFTDLNDSPVNALLGVKITTLPTAGTLTLNGFGLSAGDTVAVADIPNLVFTPALNANGTGYATFTFQVQDNGGTTNSGVDLDASANTIGFNVTSVNDAPSGTNATLSVVENSSRVLTAADFGYSDVDGNAFAAIRVSALPGAGQLMFDADGSGPGVAVSASVGQIVTIADINAGKLAYVTPGNVNNGATSFSFQVQDNGGTANGGVDLDQSPNTIGYTLVAATPPGSPPPVTIGNTTYVEADYVQPSTSTATVISPRVQADNIALNITGNAGVQTIIGNYGPNVLNDGGGADTLIGLLNNDTYIVSNSGTVVVENNGEGSDMVLTSVSYILPTGASIETLAALPATGTAPIFLTGNAFDQRITGNAGDNIINGLGGSDTMAGLGGNDTYLVRGPGDVVIEANGEGTDTIYTTVSYNLGANEVEVLSTVTHTDTTPINLTGNYLSQTIIGNYGDNLLNGGSGIDTLIGLYGNDLYAVGDSRIVIVETDGQGTDTVVTSVSYTLGTDVSVEVLSAQDRSSTIGLSLTGNRFGQTIAGTEGADTINGGAGNDVLIGGGGADRFDFTTLLGATNVDAITDFGSTDRIGLSSAIFGAIGATLDAGEFVTGSAALDADDRIVYNQATGQIFYDADGNGAGLATLFAVVTPGTILSSASFTIIAP